MRCNYEERFRQRACLALGGYLVFFHGFEQRTLCFGRGAVYLVGQNDLREDRPRVEVEIARLAIEDRDAENVGGQQVAGKLDALKMQPQRGCQCVGEGGLADAGNILDQQVATREHARDGEPDLMFLAEDDFADLIDDGIELRVHDCAIVTCP